MSPLRIALSRSMRMERKPCYIRHTSTHLSPSPRASGVVLVDKRRTLSLHPVPAGRWKGRTTPRDMAGIPTTTITWKFMTTHVAGMGCPRKIAEWRLVIRRARANGAVTWWREMFADIHWASPPTTGLNRMVMSQVPYARAGLTLARTPGLLQLLAREERFSD